MLHEVYGHLTSNQYPSYDIVISASEKLDLIVRSLPTEVQEAAESSQNPAGPVYVWRFLLMMMAYRLYIVHRSFFVKSLSDPQYEASRLACIRAAETIISLANKGLPAVFYRLWNTTLWLVAAGLVMGVDLVHAASEKKIYLDVAARRRRLSVLVDLLHDSADRSGIGERGANLIKHICSMEHDILVGSSSELQLSRDDIFNIVRSSGNYESPLAARNTASGSTNTAWDAPLRRQAAFGQKLQSDEMSTSNQFVTPSAEELTDMDFGLADSDFFMPQWDDGGRYRTLIGSDPGRNHVDALFADLLPNPPT